MAGGGVGVGARRGGDTVTSLPVHLLAAHAYNLPEHVWAYFGHEFARGEAPSVAGRSGCKRSRSGTKESVGGVSCQPTGCREHCFRKANRCAEQSRD